MWFRELNDLNDAYRYEVDDTDPVYIETKDGRFGRTVGFFIQKYYVCNDKSTSSLDGYRYKGTVISLETLVNNFVLIDSDTDKLVKELIEFRNRKKGEELDDTLRPFLLRETVEISTKDEYTPQVQNILVPTEDGRVVGSVDIVGERKPVEL